MRVAVVAVGDELLLGEVVNSNLARVGRALADAGLETVRAYEVGDGVEAIAAVLREALGAADAVVVCGGLGPTSDDRTREALAAVAGVALRREPDLLARLESWYSERGRAMPPATAVQADLPDGARALPNPVGSAPGMLLEIDGRVVLAVPGVPRELEAMVEASVVPALRERAGLPAALATRQLRVAVLGESLVAERLATLEADLPSGVRLSYLASPGDVRVRFVGTDVPLLSAMRERAAALLGDVVSGYGDETLPRTVLRLLADLGSTLAVAESLTGGAVASTLVEIPGASTVFRGGVVAYASDLKTALLGVPADVLERVGAVHEDVARAMADGVRQRLGADWGLATTGVAGPDAQDGVPPGTVVVAIAGPERDVVVRRLELRGDRAAVRALSVVHALDLLRRALQAGPDSRPQPPESTG